MSIALTRQMLWRGLALRHQMEVHSIDSRVVGRRADAAEGVPSFLEKDRPAYPDRVSIDMPEFYLLWEIPPCS